VFKGVGLGAGRWHVGAHLLGSISEISRRHAGVGYQQGALANISDSCQPQVQCCAGQRGWSVSAGTVPHVRIGVSWIQRQIGQKSFCRKDKKGLAKLNPEERMLFSCLKAIPLDRIIRVWYLVRQESSA
jgi:hypothetical protein